MDDNVGINARAEYKDTRGLTCGPGSHTADALKSNKKTEHTGHFPRYSLKKGPVP